MRAAAIDSIFIPGPRVHERFDEQPEGRLFIELKVVQQSAEWCARAAALRKVIEGVANLIAQRALDFYEVDEGAIVVSINDEVADHYAPIHAGDVISMFPPLAGG